MNPPRLRALILLSIAAALITLAMKSTAYLVTGSVGLLSDAPKENYQIQLTGLAPGEHTIAVQVSDRFGNSAAAKIAFTASNRASR